MDTTPLERIGLTSSEIKVYLALLRLGQTTAGPIVDEAQVTRSKIYDILQRLKQKGLVSHIIKEKTKYFSAADPHNIITYLDKKEAQIKQDKKEITKILSTLLAEQSLAQEKKIAEVYIGMRGMENAFNTIAQEFDRGEPYYAFGAGQGEEAKYIQLFFAKFHSKRAKKHVKSYIIFNRTSKGLFKSQEQSPFVEVRYLDIATPTAINLYKDYVIIAIITKQPITLLIKNKEVADSFKHYFNIMWKIATKK